MGKIHQASIVPVEKGIRSKWKYPQVSYREGQTTQELFEYIYEEKLPEDCIDAFEILVKWRSNIARNRKLRWRPYSLYRFPSKEEVKEMLDANR